jgi:hypothetical protein
VRATRERSEDAGRALELAPVRELFETYAGRVRPRGEPGVLSYLHLRPWLEYLELREYLSLP